MQQSKALGSLEHSHGHTQRALALTEQILDYLLANAWISYLLIAALQLKVIWGIWRLRDLTGGDTSSYFTSAYRWSQDLTTNPVWSPLYTAFYGTIHILTGDVYASGILHRAIIVMATTLGVLAILRKLLPPALALLIAAWWAVLPINFEVLYEVHLFAFLPVLAALLVTGSSDTPWMRGIALAILVVATLLARLELVVGVVVYAFICFFRETLELRRDHIAAGPVWRARAVAYMVPLAIAIGVCVIFVWRSSVPYDRILHAVHDRHALNMCQGYAFTWLQIHTDSKLNPWFECRQIMQAVFGQSWPTLGEMIAANPAAVREYFWWNFSLVPSGLQVSLFDAMSGTVNPDYGPVRHVGSKAALVLGLLVLFVVGCGCVAIIRRWDYWGATWFGPRKGLWFMILALLCVSFPVFLAIRPRSSYLFPTTLALMAMTGTAIYVLLPSRWQIGVKLLAVIGVPILVITQAAYYKRHPSDRPLYTNYERLRPFTIELANGRNRIVFGDHYGELGSYLILNKRPREIFGYEIFSFWQAPESLDHFLDRQQINVLLIQPGLMRDLKARPEARQLLEHPESLGWRRLAPPDGSDDTWLLLYREPRVSALRLFKRFSLTLVAILTVASQA
jgi:hypothetical protein